MIHGVIYILEAEGTALCKVGYSGTRKGVIGRIDSLQAGSPVYLELIGILSNCTFKSESRLHKKMDLYRIHCEWFLKNDIILDSIMNEKFKNPIERERTAYLMKTLNEKKKDLF